MKSESWNDINGGKMDCFDFFELAINEFPLLEKKMDEWENEYFHMRMEIFSEYTIEQIKNNNIAELMKCFNFIEYKIDIINAELENALNVSYCENLLLGNASEEMDRIADIMPVKLKTICLNYKLYYHNLIEKQNQ